MVPPTEEYMNGFDDLMAGYKKSLATDQEIRFLEEKLAADINLGLQVVNTSSSGSSLLASEIITGKEKRGPLQSSAPKKKELPQPEPGMRYVSALNNKNLVDKLLADLDPEAIGLSHIPETKIGYFTIPRGTSEATSPKIIFFIPELEDYNPLALGKSLLEQRVALHLRSMELKDKVKYHLLENKERNAQVIFTGYSSGAILAQLTAIRLMFDTDLQLYKQCHRVVSIVFGDVRVFSDKFVRSIDANGFDHQDHLCFCSTEAFLPINVALRGPVTWVGRRLPLDLQLIAEKYVEPTPQNLNQGFILASVHPLTKFLHWNIFKQHTKDTLDAFELGRKVDKSQMLGKAIEALQNHFKIYRLANFPNIYVDCVHDPHGDELDRPVPSNRLICTVKDTVSKAEINLFFNVFWTDDVHDINQRFKEELVNLRKKEYVYEFAKIRDQSKVKAPTSGLKAKKQALGPRYKFSNWTAFFRAQVSENISPEENGAILINPFFDESTYFELDAENHTFRYNLYLSSEVLMRKLLSTESKDQLLIKILFGPVTTKLMYQEINRAKQLFRAPSSAIEEQQASLANLIAEMFKAPVQNPSLTEFVQIDETKTWGDFKITRLGSMHMTRFKTDVQLNELVEMLGEPGKAKDCSYALPAKECPKMTLLNIASPFWGRTYSYKDLYISFRGSGMGYTMQTNAKAFCEQLQGREYEKIGSAMVLEVYSSAKSYGGYLSPRYTFYVLIVQDPKNSQ